MLWVWDGGTFLLLWTTPPLCYQPCLREYTLYWILVSLTLRMQLEDTFCMIDPFCDLRKPLCLGSNCSQCNRIVCSSPSCSTFYTKRFCRPCLEPIIGHFPKEIQMVQYLTSIHHSVEVNCCLLLGFSAVKANLIIICQEAGNPWLWATWSCVLVLFCTL